MAEAKKGATGIPSTRSGKSALPRNDDNDGAPPAHEPTTPISGDITRDHDVGDDDENDENDAREGTSKGYKELEKETWIIDGKRGARRGSSARPLADLLWGP
ncbi:uncharacterized protein N7515_009850 [Penicillium bovifimosum]|uniref:Uncharacterized protein n=1 Tax=Penicillium bovifimosum TaxID=126998 RepID=A0A9W9GIQ2_9EURO|nr:uncharacterized protein N7515_009850 [Penicillium bovifimosum]KAJ5120462.1 hypothetical protein N7515_009850 [Penicillium bovifimosum]